MNKTSIEWTHRPETGGADGGFTWNPIRARLSGGQSGTFCTRISPGCTNCYASTINKRFGNGLEYTVPNLDKVQFYISEKILGEPLRRKKPATIFVGDMFDLFHEAIPFELTDKVFAAMKLAPQHTFQVLTKRAVRLRDYILFTDSYNPLPNVWVGVSVESQKYADERIPLLLQTPAAVRFLSVEPLLEVVDLWSARYQLPGGGHGNAFDWGKGVSWVICGGESGRGARPMHPEWARQLQAQCAAANVPFFFKQWGEWQPHEDPPAPKGDYHGGVFLLLNGQLGNQGDWWKGRAQAMDRLGKKKSGAFLDGREWREFPTSQKVESVPA